MGIAEVRSRFSISGTKGKWFEANRKAPRKSSAKPIRKVTDEKELRELIEWRRRKALSLGKIARQNYDAMVVAADKRLTELGPRFDILRADFCLKHGLLLEEIAYTGKIDSFRTMEQRGWVESIKSPEGRRYWPLGDPMDNPPPLDQKSTVP